MADYIDRDLFAREVNRLSTNPFNEWDTMGILLLLDTIPSADVQPVVYGEWIKPVDNFCYQCSVCGEYSNSELPNKPWNYCPNCGTQMDKEPTDI